MEQFEHTTSTLGVVLWKINKLLAQNSPEAVAVAQKLSEHGMRLAIDSGANRLAFLRGESANTEASPPPDGCPCCGGSDEIPLARIIDYKKNMVPICRFCEANIRKW